MLGFTITAMGVGIGLQQWQSIVFVPSTPRKMPLYRPDVVVREGAAISQKFGLSCSCGGQ